MNVLRFRIQTAPSTASSTLVDRAVEACPVEGELRLGRRAGLEVELPFRSVSALHARIVRSGRGWSVIDLGSANGTYFGDRRLTPHAPHPLAVGDTVRLADVSVTLESDGEQAGAPPPSSAPAESTATLARRLVNDLFRALPSAELARVIVTAGPAAGRSLALTLPDHPYRVGRAPGCDLVLPDEDVSREHASFERRWQGVFVRDLGSKNGVELGGARIAGERRLHDGARIVVGNTELRIEDPEERYLRQMQTEAAADEPPAGPLQPAPDRAAAPPSPGTLAVPGWQWEAEENPRRAEPREHRKDLPPAPAAGSQRAVVALAVLALILVLGVAGIVLFGKE